MKPTIYYVDALAGAGKTHSAIQDSIQQAALGAKIAIVQPSKHLIAESHAKALKMAQAAGRSVRITRIDSDAAPAGVTPALTSHLRYTNQADGEILFITHAALLGCPYWHARESWSLIVDEIISPIADKSMRLPRNHDRLTSWLDLASYNAHYSVLACKEDAESLTMLERLVLNPGDDAVDEVLRPIAQLVASSDWTLFAQAANWCAIRAGTNKHDALTMYALLNPRFFAEFRQTTIMGAMFQDSILAKVWADAVDFRVHARIQRALRYQVHAAGGALTIEYLFDRNWSKAFRNSRIAGRQVFDLALERCAEAMSGRDYIFITNRDAEEMSRKMLATGQKVSNVCHGINEYQHIDNAVFLSALNPAPSQFKMLSNLDVSADELSDAGYHQTVYQAVMRTSLRDPASTTSKHIVVPDRRAADYLAQQFPGCKVVRNKHLPVITQADVSRGGRPKDWISQAQRDAARAKRGRIDREQAALTRSAPARRISIVASIHSADAETFEFESNDDLIAQLREASHTTISTKKENVLVSPAVFNAALSQDTKRGLANIEYVNGLWLDNDAGDLTWQDFRAIFPCLRMVAFSTFSGGNRYRVFIPTTTPMTIEVDHVVKRVIMDELADRGFMAPGKQTEARPMTHGFDVSKLTPSSLFFMPCRAADGSDFFEEMDGEELDPAVWARRAPLTMFREEVAPLLPALPAAPPAVSKLDAIRLALAEQPWAGPSREQRISDALDTYRAIPAHAGLRNTEFFKLGCQLQDTGLDLQMIETILTTNANDRDRKAQVKSIMSSLRRRETKKVNQ